MRRPLPFTVVCCALLAACGSAPERPPAPVERANSYNELGFEAFAAGRYPEAARHFREAERFFLSVDDPAATARAAISLAEVLLLLDDFDAAAQAIKRADAAVARTPDPDVKHRLGQRTRLLKARFAHANGNDAAARRLLQEIESDGRLARHAALLNCQMDVAAGETGCVDGLSAGPADTEAEPLLQARIERLRAEAAMRNGDQTLADTHLERALQIYRAEAYRPGLAAVHETRGRMLAARDPAAAREHLERALYLHAWIHDRGGFRGTLDLLIRLADDAALRQRYREWGERLGEDPDVAAWQSVLEMIRPR